MPDLLLFQRSGLVRHFKTIFDSKRTFSIEAALFIHHIFSNSSIFYILAFLKEKYRLYIS